MRLRNDKFVVAIPAVATTGNAWGLAWSQALPAGTIHQLCL